MKNRSKPRRARRAQKVKKTLYRKDAPLRTFPIEVRNMIYRLLLTNSWEKEQTHVRKVLAGLRGDPGLYKEALIIFYETNIFCLTEDNHWLRDYFVTSNGVRFMDTSMIHLAATWEKVYVKVPIAILATGPLHGLPSRTGTFDRTARMIRMAQNLTYLHIEATTSSSCRTKWLALVCDLVGPADCCPALQKLEFTWSFYMLELYGHAIGFTLCELNRVFCTEGRLEGAFTGMKGSWVWEHRGKDKGKPLTWGKDPVNGRAIMMTLDGDMLEQMDHDLSLNQHRSLAIAGAPSLFYPPVPGVIPGTEILTRRPFRRGMNEVADNLESYDREPMWKPVYRWELNALRIRCEREFRKGSLIQDEERDYDYITKWLYDQGFETELDHAYRHRRTDYWRANQGYYDTSGRRGEEGDIDFVPKVVEIDDFDARSRAPSIDAQPTAAHPQPERTHSALPFNWDVEDSDEGLPEGVDVPETDSLLAFRLRQQKEHGWPFPDDESVTPRLVEDLVFAPGEARFQVLEPTMNLGSAVGRK